MATAARPAHAPRSAPPPAGPLPVGLPPAPRLAGLWATLVFAAAALLLGHEALAGRFLVNPNSDQYIAGYAFRNLAAVWERAGHGVPLWNPYMFGGMPFVAAMDGDIFYPTALLRILLGTDRGMTWGFILHVFLAGCFTYLYLRRALGLSFHGALIGGLAYMMGGNVAGLVSPGHDGKLFIAALLPLDLFFLHRGVRDGRTWAWGALALGVTLAALTPHPQLFQYLLLVLGAYALWLALSRRDDGEPMARPVVVRRLAFALGAVVLGLAGSAIQYLPLSEYTPWSPRAGGAGWEHAISFSLPPEELLNTYLPQFSGILNNYAGRNVIHLHSEYIGAAVLLLAGLAFGARARRGALRFWTGALVVSTLWALGGYTPFYHLIYALVPGTPYFRAPSTMLYVVSFCVAVLAAIGTERALADRPRPRYALAWVGAALLLGVLALGGALSTMAESFSIAELADRVSANKGELIVGAWRSALVVVAVAGLLLARWRGALAPRATAWALAAVVALDLWSIERLYWQFSAPAAQLYADDPVLQYLEHLPEPGRVVPIANPQTLTAYTRDPYFGGGDGRAGGLMVHDIRSVVGYHGNELGRYLDVTGWSEGSRPGDWPKQLGNPNLWRLLNIQYMYTNMAEAPIPGMTRVAGPSVNVAGDTAYLYRFPGSNPDAWVVPLAVKAGDAAVLATVLDPRFDVGRAAMFDTASAVPTQPVPGALPNPLDLAARVTRLEPGHIQVALDRPAPANAALVVSENYYPGWHATVDGKPAPTGRADYVLTGVALPAGARSVDLTYTSATYERGRLVTLLAGAAALLLVIGGLVADRRPATVAPA